MGWNPLKDVKKAVKSVTSAVGDIGTGLYKGAKNISDKTYEYTVEKTGLEKGVKEIGKGLEKGVSEIGKGVETAGREIGKGIENVGQEVGRGVENVGREVGKAWDEYGLKEAVTAGLLVAGTIYTGGALAGMAGATTATGAAVTGASTLGSTAALTAVGTSAVQSGMQGRQAYKQAEATREYQRQVDAANRKALEERKSSLLKTKKQLMPNLTKSSQGGTGGSLATDEDITLQLG